MRPTRWSSSAAATRNARPTGSARGHPVADLAPEHDQIGAPHRAPAAGRAACRSAPARRPAPRPPARSRSTSRRAAAIGSSRLAAQLRRQRRVRDAEHADPDAAHGLRAARAPARGDGGRLTASRGGTTSAAPPRMSVSASPAANGPSLPSSRRQERARAARRSPATSSVLVSGNDSPPAVEHQHRAAALARPRAPASRSARCRPADRWCSRTARASRGSRPCRRSSAAAPAARGAGDPASATAAIAAIRATARSRAANGARMGSTMAIPTSPLAIPGLLPAACLTAAGPPFKFASSLFEGNNPWP